MLQIPIILMGLMCMWLWYDSLFPKSFDLSKHKWVACVCSLTFFIYSFHEPTINIVRKILLLPYGHSSFGVTFSYTVSPWLCVLFAFSIGEVLKKYVPRFYGILVGGR